MSDDFENNQTDEAGDDLDLLRTQLGGVLADFAEEREVDPEFLAMLLLDAAINQRAVAYAMTVAKPSESGLKLELDRLNRTFSEMVRDARKEAGTTLTGFLAALAEMDKEGWEEEGA